MKQSAFISALKFVAHAKAKNDVRYYLNAVKLEIDNETMTIIATDGHRMAWAEIEAPGMKAGEYLVNGADIDTALKAMKANSTGAVVLNPIDTAGYLTLENNDGEVFCRLVDGKFPDWRRVASVPAGAGPSALDKTINGQYLGDAGKAFGAVTDKYGAVTITMNPDGHCLHMEARGPKPDGVLSAHCIIMPMRK